MWAKVCITLFVMAVTAAVALKYDPMYGLYMFGLVCAVVLLAFIVPKIKSYLYNTSIVKESVRNDQFKRREFERDI